MLRSFSLGVVSVFLLSSCGGSSKSSGTDTEVPSSHWDSMNWDESNWN
ncbi:MAG: hypothetical protein HWE27_11855 [Gammaproteobacteria bacterium]|nr:hypothetical protein [Gammaproteobacteria bacterium]